MKRWSIKWKIIFLYTFVFALLVILDFYLLRTTAIQVLSGQSERNVVTATEEVASLIQIEDDGIYYEDDDQHFSYYHDGVIFLLYDGSSVAFGQVPTSFDSSLPISLDTIQSQTTEGMSWLTYDVSVERGYVLRGIYDTSPITDSLRQIILIAGILTPAIIVLASLGGYLIISRSFRPIRRIYQTAASIKDEGDYSKRIPLDASKDEVHELAVMVNGMLDRVEQSISREKQFSSNVSHELRTPLTVMQAQAEYLLLKTKDNDAKDDIRTILSQVAFMENIVTQLLEITRSKQLPESEMELVDLHELIRFTADTFTSQLEDKHISMEIKEPGFKVLVRSHQTMMIRVFSNLIINAIKYNKENGSILIDFRKNEDQVVVLVSDTGIGIPQEKVDKIFDPFYRADESRKQNDFSLGLGLAMAREVIRIHRGDIQVQSVENIGTTFKVSLPLAE